MFRTLLTTLALGVIASLAAALLATSPAFAHARWKSSTPGKGEAITASPARVEIEFTQEIQKISGSYTIQVVKDRGLDVTAGPAVVDDADRHKLSVPIAPGLTAGRYVVNWSNTSDDDGDPATGAFSFYLNYTPNAVDRANDAQLDQIGFEEETPAAGSTPGATAAATPSSRTPASTAVASAAVSSPTKVALPVATTTPAGATSDDGGLSTAALVAIIAIASLAGIGIGFGVWQLSNRRR